MATDEVVYLVDDDCGVRQSIGGLLESAGLQLVSFASAADFLGHVRASDAACLILDLQLPGISGLELQGKLADENSPPVIFISGRSDVPSTVQAMKAGAVEFLVKPISPDVLLASVQAALAKDRLLRMQREELARLRDHYSLLSHREREVLPLIVSGLLNKQSASVLGIAEVTLQVHRRQIMTKMQAGSLAELVRMATQLGIPLISRETGRQLHR